MTSLSADAQLVSLLPNFTVDSPALKLHKACYCISDLPPSLLKSLPANFTVDTRRILSSYLPRQVSQLTSVLTSFATDVSACTLHSWHFCTPNSKLISLLTNFAACISTFKLHNRHPLHTNFTPDVSANFSGLCVFSSFRQAGDIVCYETNIEDFSKCTMQNPSGLQKPS